jgi:DNA (cytosine-5)-methyltransferase 1
MALGMWIPGAVSVSWHAEIDPDASMVLKSWHPDVPNLGDFTVPGFWERAERTDCHVGGIPCQPFSAAGRQRGEEDPRHLWPHWREGIALHRPATVVFENVAGLVRGKMRPVFDSIVRDLVELGYDVRWCLLGACAVGAAHHRHRVFLLACRSRSTPNARQVQVQTCGQREAAYLPTPLAAHGLGQGRGRNGRGEPNLLSIAELIPAQRQPTPLELLPTVIARDSVDRNQGDEAYWERRRARGKTAQPPLAAVAAMLPTPAVRDAGTASPAEFERNSLALRTQVLDLLRTPAARDGEQRGQGTVEHMQRRIAAGHTINLGDQVQLLPSPRHSDAKNGGPNQGIASGDIALSSAVQPERWGRFAGAVARHEFVLGRPAPDPTEYGPKGGRRLSAVFSEWLMMLPEGHLTSVLGRNAALARAGNGVVPLQAATALRILFDNLVMGH